MFSKVINAALFKVDINSIKSDSEIPTEIAIALMDLLPSHKAKAARAPGRSIINASSKVPTKRPSARGETNTPTFILGKSFRETV